MAPPQAGDEYLLLMSLAASSSLLQKPKKTGKHRLTSVMKRTGHSISLLTEAALLEPNADN